MNPELRVLLVEDSENDAELVTRQLRRSGYDPRVVRVETAEAMRVELREREWDLVLADFTLPAFSGLHALEIVQQAELDVPFILISGSIGEEVAVNAMKSGAHDYLLKQNMARLGPAVARELREAEVRRQRRRAASRWEFLSNASAVLNGALDVGATLAGLARLSVPALADWCVIELVGRDATTTELAVEHVDRSKVCLVQRLSRRSERSAAFGANQVLRSGQPELHPAIGDELFRSIAPSEAELEALRALDPRSALVIPLAARSRIFGTITLVSSESGRRYDAEDLVLAEELGRRAAVAIDNARLYADTQEAVRVRDEFIAVAAHELRTPLTPLVLELETLQLALRSDPTPELQSRAVIKLEKALRQTGRLAGLVETLLNVSSLSTGRIELACEELDLCEALRDVVAELGGDAERAGCSLDLKCEGPTTGRWDRLRVHQIFVNVVSNALKYGPNRPVEVGVRGAPNAVTVSVRDHGIGFSPADSQRIFERFERAVSHQHYGGLGLGLYVARQLIEAHAGSIETTSALGEGSTFVVILPRRPSSSDTPVGGAAA